MARCTAKLTDGSRQCRNDAVRGAEVCFQHGAAAGQVQRAAARNVRTQEAAERLHRMGVDPIGDPFVVLEELAAEAVALKELLAKQVDAIDDEDPSWGAYERALDRAERFTRHLAQLDLDERRVELSEQQGQLVAQVVQAFAGALLSLVRSEVEADRLDVERLAEIERERVPKMMRTELLAAIPDEDGQDRRDD